MEGSGASAATSGEAEVTAQSANLYHQHPDFVAQNQNMFKSVHLQDDSSMLNLHDSFVVYITLNTFSIDAASICDYMEYCTCLKTALPP